MKRKSIQEFATEIGRMFTEGTHTDGAKYWYSNDTAPVWVREMCLNTHGDMLPDDWKYAFIVYALRSIGECEDRYLNDPDIAADEDYGKLLTWFSSHMSRVARVDEAISMFGKDENIMLDIMAAQAEEKREVYFTVLSFLHNKLNKIECD